MSDKKSKRILPRAVTPSRRRSVVRKTSTPLSLQRIGSFRDATTIAPMVVGGSKSLSQSSDRRGVILVADDHVFEHKAVQLFSSEESPSTSSEPPQPELKEEAAPVSSEIVQPELKEEAAPVSSEPPQPELKEEAAPVSSEIVQPELKEEAAPASSEIVQPELKEEAAPVSSEIAQPELKEEAAPVSSEIVQPELKEEVPPAPIENPPVSSEIVQPELKEEIHPAPIENPPASSEIDQPELKEEVSPVSSEIDQPELKEEIHPAPIENPPVSSEIHPAPVEDPTVSSEIDQPELKEEVPPAPSESPRPELKEEVPPASIKDLPASSEIAQPELKEEATPASSESPRPELKEEVTPAPSESPPELKEEATPASIKDLPASSESPPELKEEKDQSVSELEKQVSAMIQELLQQGLDDLNKEKFTIEEVVAHLELAQKHSEDRVKYLDKTVTDGDDYDLIAIGRGERDRLVENTPRLRVKILHEMSRREKVELLASGFAELLEWCRSHLGTPSGFASRLRSLELQARDTRFSFDFDLLRRWLVAYEHPKPEESLREIIAKRSIQVEQVRKKLLLQRQKIDQLLSSLE